MAPFFPLSRWEREPENQVDVVLIRPGREGSILAALVAGQQVHRMLPQFDHEGERIRGILAVEIRGSAVQVFEAERVVDDFLDDDAWYAVVIAGRQQGF